MAFNVSNFLSGSAFIDSMSQGIRDQSNLFTLQRALRDADQSFMFNQHANPMKLDLLATQLEAQKFERRKAGEMAQSEIDRSIAEANIKTTQAAYDAGTLAPALEKARIDAMQSRVNYTANVGDIVDANTQRAAAGLMSGDTAASRNLQIGQAASGTGFAGIDKALGGAPSGASGGNTSGSNLTLDNDRAVPQAVDFVGLTDRRDAPGAVAGAHVIRNFEGVRMDAYQDPAAGAGARIGYGSDYYYDAQGVRKQAHMGAKITPQVAERLLQERVSSLIDSTKRAIGETAWTRMSPQQQAGVLSLGYRYSDRGILGMKSTPTTDALRQALRTGDMANASVMIRRLQDAENKKQGKNWGRGYAEADLVERGAGKRNGVELFAPGYTGL